MAEVDPVPWNHVPFYGLLKDFEWIEDFLESLKIKSALKELVDDKKAVRARPVPVSEYREQLKAGYEDYRKQRVQYIKNHVLGRSSASSNPFPHFKEFSSIYHRLTLFVEWEEVEAALSEMGDEGAMNAVERQAALAEVEERIARQKEALARVSPEKYFKFKDGGVQCDARREFFNHWAGCQEWLNQPCGPQKYHLSFSPAKEQEAYQRLGLSRFIKRECLQEPATPWMRDAYTGELIIGVPAG